MKRIETFKDLYQYTISHPQNIKHWDAIKIIRELVYTLDECGLGDYQDELIEQQITEINDILGLEEENDGGSIKND